MSPSPDDIFAAQFWTWPDPALKRDAHGRVLFVNAAFLQLFGGQVENWRGQMIEGWHVPTPGPEPVRFETRIPEAPGLEEQIYDWIEQTGPDGAAFALARNVTFFAAQTHAQPSAKPSELYSDTLYESAETSSESLAEAMPFEPEQPVMEDPVEFHDSEPYVEPPEAQAQAPGAPQSSPERESSSLFHTVEEEDEYEVVVPVAEPQEEIDPLAMGEIEGDHEALAETTERDDEPPQRDFERRPLPIENEEAVLGNNWRDAVIAKAVGASDSPEETESAKKSDTVSTRPSGKSQTDGPVRILLAEDNAINALLTRTLLEAEGHTVETVEDGVQAVEAMKAQNFDMIFMDMRMPNMDGLEATRTIRRLPNVPSDLPIVALTANAFDDDRNACFDSGMNDFMTKPVSAEELKDMVGRWAYAEARKKAS